MKLLELKNNIIKLIAIFISYINISKEKKQ